LIARKLLISQKRKNARIVPSADLRYTAGTRTTNSLVGVRDECRPLRLLRASFHCQ
jgi:hypothetical protein